MSPHLEYLGMLTTPTSGCTAGTGESAKHPHKARRMHWSVTTWTKSRIPSPVLQRSCKSCPLRALPCRWNKFQKGSGVQDTVEKQVLSRYVGMIWHDRNNGKISRPGLVSDHDMVQNYRHPLDLLAQLFPDKKQRKHRCREISAQNPSERTTSIINAIQHGLLAGVQKIWSLQDQSIEMIR